MRGEFRAGGLSSASILQVWASTHCGVRTKVTIEEVLEALAEIQPKT
jgi:hypothetical protein